MNDLLEQAIKDAEKFAEIDEAQLKGISQLASRLMTLEAFIDKMKTLTPLVNIAIEKIRDKMLPDAMLAAGTKGLTLDNGAKLEVKKATFASIKKDDKPKVFDWMVKNGFGSIIDVDIRIPLGKSGMLPGEDKEPSEADRIRAIIREKCPELDNVVEVQGDIHWQTLRAFARELVEKNEKLPKDQRIQPPPELKIHQADQAKITLPRVTG